MIKLKNKYRIVRDNYLGFEAQVKRWYWPFWDQIYFCNTWGTLEKAEECCTLHASGKSVVVKDLGYLP